VVSCVWLWRVPPAMLRRGDPRPVVHHRRSAVGRRRVSGRVG
jgi:hypothetical protein